MTSQYYGGVFDVVIGQDVCGKALMQRFHSSAGLLPRRAKFGDETPFFQTFCFLFLSVCSSICLIFCFIMLLDSYCGQHEAHIPATDFYVRTNKHGFFLNKLKMLKSSSNTQGPTICCLLTEFSSHCHTDKCTPTLRTRTISAM